MRIEARQAEVDGFLSKYFPPKAKGGGSSRGASKQTDLTDAQIIEKASRAKNGAKFARLFDGQWETDYASQSEADLGLCCLLTFWTGPNASRIDRLFRRSGLFREKWDEKHAADGSTYGQKTIEAALARVGETYSGKAASASVSSETTGDWKSRLLCTVDKSGNVKVKPVVANAILILGNDTDWCGVVGWDDFAQRVMVRKRPPYSGPASPFEPRDWRDEDDIQTAAWFQATWALFVNPEIARQAALTIARDNSFHPVRDYLSALRWDGVARLDSMLSTYFGVKESPYASAVSCCWTSSAVARVFEPGCKADHVVILEGRQGLKKSTGLGVLGGSWFTDEIDAIGSKDAATQLQGVWIVELPELDAMSRSEVSRTKAFMSKSFDRFRPPYGKHAILFERQCVFAGTVNHTDYLRDETGNRRFWPVKCSGVTKSGEVDIEGLRRDRDQLWAEAVARYKAGDKWWLESAELVESATTEQDARLSTDAWEPAIARFVRGKDWTTIAEVLSSLDVLTPKQGQAEQNRVARCLKRLGWQRKQRVIEGIRVWGYERPAPVEDESPVDHDESGDDKASERRAPSPPSPVSPLSLSLEEEEKRKSREQGEERVDVRRVEGDWCGGASGETGAPPPAEHPCVTCGAEVGSDAFFCPTCWSARHVRPRNASPESAESCGACGEADFWRTPAGNSICRRCHPPVNEVTH